MIRLKSRCAYFLLWAVLGSITTFTLYGYYYIHLNRVPGHMNCQNGHKEAYFTMDDYFEKRLKMQPVSEAVSLLKEFSQSYDFGFDDMSTFRSVSGEGIYTLRNVCFEDRFSEPPVLVSDTEYSNYKRIVVYGANQTGEKILSVAAGFKPWNWKILYNEGPVPTEYKMYPYPAYFVITSCTGNLYHFLHDSTVGLYGVLKSTGRLGPQYKNQVFYRKSESPVVQSNCHALHRYEKLLFTMGVLPTHNVYHAAPPRSCFKYGVFGWKQAPLPEVMNYMKGVMGISDLGCKAKTVTIIQRLGYRKILNVDELKDTAIKLGYPNTQVIILENMDIKEQISVMGCTDILVGVQGAGLQWAEYMKPNKGLLELVFTNWTPSFSVIYKKKLVTAHLFTENVEIVWRYIENHYNHGKKFKEEQKPHLIQQAKDDPFDKKPNTLTNVFKFANPTYDSKVFGKSLSKLASQVFVQE